MNGKVMHKEINMAFLEQIKTKKEYLFDDGRGRMTALLVEILRDKHNINIVNFDRQSLFIKSCTMTFRTLSLIHKIFYPCSNPLGCCLNISSIKIVDYSFK